MIAQNKKYVLIFIMMLGIAGGLLFFPLQLNDGYTCFYHRFFDSDRPVIKHAHIITQIQEHHSTEMIDAYISGYAFFWWGSLVLTGFGIYKLNFYKSPNPTKTY